jgi:hypothetical protein
VVGTVALTPLMCNTQVISFPNGIQTYNTTDTSQYFEIITNGVSPTGTVIPTDVDSFFNIAEVPITGLLTSIANTTGSFQQNILQQGARF